MRRLVWFFVGAIALGSGRCCGRRFLDGSRRGIALAPNPWLRSSLSRGSESALPAYAKDKRIPLPTQATFSGAKAS